MSSREETKQGIATQALINQTKFKSVHKSQINHVMRQLPAEFVSSHASFFKNECICLGDLCVLLYLHNQAFTIIDHDLDPLEVSVVQHATPTTLENTIVCAQDYRCKETEEFEKELDKLTLVFDSTGVSPRAL